MAGGAGERFWPLSRISKPKHLWNVAGGNGCLLEQTLERVAKVVPSENILVITNAEQVENMLKFCPSLKPEQVVSEPLARDTTAAIGLAAELVKIKSGGEDSSFAVFPSDQVIEGNFAGTIASAFDVAESVDNLVSVGIEPAFPATGYGYIQRGEEASNSFGKYYKIARFYEKPNLARASLYVNSGEFYWNAGMFIWKTSTIIAALEKHVPASAKIFAEIGERLSKGGNISEILAAEYPKIEKISIDFSVMERADNAWVVPSDFVWDDVGSWSAIERHYKKDALGNIAQGELYEKESKDCVVFDAANRATALVGVKDLIVVHSADATLICAKECSEEVKGLVRSLPQKYR